jgi:hypothetical protein
VFKRCVFVAVLTIAVLLRPAPAAAYDIDVHFYLTYVLARLAGLTDPQAFLVARADQSLDDNSATTAFQFPLPPRHYRAHGKAWHALNRDQATVMQRFRVLQCRAGVTRTLDRNIETGCAAAPSANDPLLFVALGEFLHYYQDTYAHSRSSELTPDWVPYGATFGHFFAGVGPDLVANRPALAELMAVDVFEALKTFAVSRGEVRDRYASERQIRAIVGVLAGAYPREPGIPRPRDGKQPPHMSNGMPVYWDDLHFFDPANLHTTRCALSAYLSSSGILSGAPDVAKVRYTRLGLDERGDPQPQAASFVPSPIEPIRC